MDVSRNFQPKQVILKLLDAMAMYKLNKFHFHLTDDEGWRLEIPGLPELTEVAIVYILNDTLNTLFTVIWLPELTEVAIIYILKWLLFL